MSATPASTSETKNTASRRTRGPSASTPARRAEIVRAASASIAEHGYERASLRDIAARANVTHAALLRHFASKDELLLAALTQRDEDDEELARQIMRSPVPAERVLSSVLREEFAHPEQQRNWLAITVAATNPDHPAHDFFIKRRERMRTHLSSGRLATTHDSEELSADDKVTMVMAMMDGLRIQALLDPTRQTLPLLETFMRLIATQDDAHESGPVTEVHPLQT
jgi:AcrR family transcriptional regulator